MKLKLIDIEIVRYFKNQYMSNPINNVYQKYAWFPRKTKSGKIIWLTDYILLVKTYYSLAGESEIPEKFVYTKNEWLLEEIKQPSKRYTLPSKKNRIFY